MKCLLRHHDWVELSAASHWGADGSRWAFHGCRRCERTRWRYTPSEPQAEVVIHPGGTDGEAGSA